MRKMLFATLVCLLSLVSLGCSDVYLIEEFHKQTEDGWEPAGAGCMLLDDTLSSSEEAVSDPPAEASDFSASTLAHKDAATVVVASQGEELLRETFNESFLESGEKKTFTVETVDGVTYRLRYWGDDVCDYPTQE